jgi:hypothetical protein
MEERDAMMWQLLLLALMPAQLTVDYDFPMRMFIMSGYFFNWSDRVMDGAKNEWFAFPWAYQILWADSKYMINRLHTLNRADGGNILHLSTDKA